MTHIICGIDVSSEALDARIGRDGAAAHFSYTSEGTDALIAFCRHHKVSLVVMEATGGYEKVAFGRLWGAGVPCAIVNPRSVRWFAEAMGVFEKTDKIDAGVIAWYAEAKRITPQPPASTLQKQLTALTVRLRQLTELKVGQSNQQRLVSDLDVRASFTDLMALLSRQIRDLENKISALIEADPLWNALDRNFRSIKGVADRTVARILANLPEIGTIRNKGASKLVGVVPFVNESGKRTGKKPIRGGREDIRSILYVVAYVVSRHEKDFIDFRKRLELAGKPKKVIRIALARKLLVRLNAKARDIRAEIMCPA